MPRAARQESPTGLYHVTARGIAGRLLFADDRDRARFVAILGRVVADCGWRLYAYCLLGTHYHLVVQTSSVPRLSDGIRLLHTRYVASFNARHDKPRPHPRRPVLLAADRPRRAPAPGLHLGRAEPRPGGPRFTHG